MRHFSLDDVTIQYDRRLFRSLNILLSRIYLSWRLNICTSVQLIAACLCLWLVVDQL